MRFVLASLALALPLAIAKTDLDGCTWYSSTVSAPTATFSTRVYYLPDTLEVCSVIDCGGGRSAPFRGTPGCPLYTGTAEPEVRFLDADPAAPASASESVAEETAVPTSTMTSAATVSQIQSESEAAESTGAASSTTIEDAAASESSDLEPGPTGAAPAARAGSVGLLAGFAVAVAAL